MTLPLLGLIFSLICLVSLAFDENKDNEFNSGFWFGMAFTCGIALVIAGVS